jgi:hypothetical protein
VRFAPGRSLAATGAIVLVAAAVVLAAAEYRSAAKPRATACATGALSSSSTQPGNAIFAAENLAPGDSATGTVTIRNPGDSAASAAVAAVSLRDTPARGGGALSGALDLSVGTEGAIVWRGKLGAMPRLRLTRLPPGTARTYRFTATLPAKGEDVGNNFQRSSVDVVYEWTLAATGGVTWTEARQCQP